MEENLGKNIDAENVFKTVPDSTEAEINQI
jgi:hypothetical protein